MVVRDGHARRQDVKLGLQATSQSEIRTGLATGEQVIPSASPVAIGDRVRAKTP
jgi:hypothetical protein